MKTGLKKVLGFVLSIVLVLSLMPQTTLKSEAAGEKVFGAWSVIKTVDIK